jgi:cytochrome c556
VKFSLISLSVFTSLILAGTAVAQNAPQQDNMKDFMRAKLEHSQDALEALTTEDFKAIRKAAQELSLLSRATQWQVLQTPEYATRSNEFRREVDALRDAAEKENLDGATLAFVKVTMNCVECHKYVRGIRQAHWQPGSELLFGNR